MPFATNNSDGVRTYFEDDDGDGPPVVFYAGLTQPLQWCRTSGLAEALRDDFRLIFADHRGHGRSDKPRSSEAYALRTRVGDFGALLDQLGLQKAHFIGFSWGARLGFAVGEHAPNRVLSLVLCGNQPYAWEPWPIVQQISAALPALNRGGMRAFVEDWESLRGGRLPEPERTWMLDNDPAAIDAAWRSAQDEGAISRDLKKWRVPCLIYVGEEDDMCDNAQRAASEIPGAIYLSLPGHTHFSASREVDLVLPHVLALLTA